MTPLLLIASAVVLGILSFFEPCTIATHTLFSVRAHRQPWSRCCFDLLGLWLIRSVLVTGLLLLAVALAAPPRIGVYAGSAILAAMATVYIVSRFQYIPVPHLEFHRLFPGGGRLPQAAQLGLTLPACTLPLFLIVLGLVITLDSYWLALASGLLFASLFTLPTIVVAITGLASSGQRVLTRSALVTPYVTAALLYGTAAYLLI